MIDNRNQVKKGKMTQHAVDNIMFAIGERAIKDFVRAMNKYNRLALERKSIWRSTRLFRADKRMQEAARFFINDPYDIFPNGGGKQIIAILKKKHGFVPVEVPTKEEYEKMMKSLEK